MALSRSSSSYLLERSLRVSPSFAFAASRTSPIYNTCRYAYILKQFISACDYCYGSVQDPGIEQLMASPIKKRTALAGKSTNIRQTPGGIYKSNSTSSHTSPNKKSQVNLAYALSNSPVRSLSISPRKNDDTGTFTFHEETPSERAATLMMHMSLSKRALALSSTDENDPSSVKENMSPSKALSRVRSPQRPSERKQLQDLSITEYPGFIEEPQSGETAPLTLHYKHKTVLPNFVTPPRDQKLRECFTTSGSGEVPTLTSRTTDDIPKDKVVRKLDFKICEN